MRTRWALAGSVVVVVGLAISIASVASASSGERTRTFHVNFPHFTTTTIDVGAKGTSPGDYYLYRGPLTNDAGQTIGRLLARSMVYKNKPDLEYLEGTAVLDGRGKITVEGPVVFSRPNQGTIAVVGGTGDFREADGTVRSTFSHGQVTLHFSITQ